MALRTRRFVLRIWLYLVITCIALAANVYAQSDIWVTAYYAGWSQGWFNNGVLPAQDINYSAVTHIIHFGLAPKPNGTFDSDVNSIRTSNSSELITRAHTAGKKVLISVGGWGTDVSFRGATSLFNLPSFIENLVTFMSERGYDGIDIDWEILELTDVAQYTVFIKQLRARLNQITPRPLLTAAVIWQPVVFSTLAHEFDQINIMTYDMSGAWPGWVSWHNAPVISSGLRFPGNGRLIPSANTMVEEFIAAGVPAKKLGIGIDFYGYIWSGGNGTSTGGVSGPRQSWTSAPHIQVNVPYYSLIPQYYQPQFFRWDTLAQAAYLGIDNPGSVNDKFITFDNELTCQKKVEYAKAKGIGGVFIWELGGGQLSSNFPARDRLLQSIKNAAEQKDILPPVPSLASPATNIIGINTNPMLSWTPSDGASSYRLQVAQDSTFTSFVLDQNWIIWNSYRTPSLNANQTYSWRIRASSPTSTSEWSATSSFTTVAHPSLPVNWAYVSQTGHIATLVIPDTVKPMIGTRELNNGDAIGVFFDQYAVGTCGGYGIWEAGKNFALSIWGDKPETPIKEGFTEGDTLRFRIWSRQTLREYTAAATIESGSLIYTKDNSYVVSSLSGSPLIRQVIALSPGENMISSFLEPSDSKLENLFAKVKTHVIALRNGSGGIFRPDSNINTVGTWNIRSGYKIFMRAADSLTIIGTETSPDTIPIPLTPGWNLISYLRNSSMQTDSALSTIPNSLLIVKDNSGSVYWPVQGINTIGTMEPGQGYQLFVTQSATLVYPQNVFVVAGPRQPPIGIFPTTARKDAAAGGHSGFNATLLIEASDLEDGDEVRVRTGTMQIGSGVVTDGRALITLWGDNALTRNTIEGARDLEPLTITAWSASHRKELPLLMESITDALTGSPTENPLRYKTDGVWIASTRQLPLTLMLEQNYPNPFNASTTIRYALPIDSRVELSLFDILGRKVLILVDQEQRAGYHEVKLQDPTLATGIYFYRLTCSVSTRPSNDNPETISSTSWVTTRKMIVLK